MKFNTTVLPNGLRVITIPMADNPAVTVLVMVETGSKYETKRENGLSHFLEHMVFKGTPKRPLASDISRELDSLGAHYNAFTSQEYTGYYAKVAPRHLDTVIDIVSDMYLNPLFEENEIKKEKGVIIEEMRMYRDLPQRHVHDVLSELLYGDQPAGWNVIGTEETLHAFKKEDFIAYRKAHYVGDSTIVVVSGAFDERKTISAIENAFGPISKDPNQPKKPVIGSQSTPQIKAEFKETDQTHLAIALRTFPIDDPRIPAMQLLSTVLGGGMSSRLFAKMRDELGICYYISASHTPYTDVGELTITAGLDNSRVEEGLKGILEELRKLKTDLVSEAEIKKAKDYIAGTTMLELETSDARAEFCGYQEILKKRVDSPEEIVERINRVTSEDVRKLAQDVFVDTGLNMAVIGRYKDGEAFKPYFKFG